MSLPRIRDMQRLRCAGVRTSVPPAVTPVTASFLRLELLFTRDIEIDCCVERQGGGLNRNAVNLDTIGKSGQVSPDIFGHASDVLRNSELGLVLRDSKHAVKIVAAGLDGHLGKFV